MSYTFTQIAEVLNGNTVRGDYDASISSLLLDSRNVYDPSHTLFFAINGAHHNGHHFIDEAYAKGVRNFVISDAFIDLANFPTANFIIVNNTTDALQQLATWHRNHFKYPVIGITGSNGKTIVKEWLYQLLKNDFNIARSPASFNSQVGVPLSIWQLSDKHNLAIIEAGISRPGEMERLEKIIQPTIGVFTGLGEAHSEGFDSSYDKKDEKFILFRNVEALICRNDLAENRKDLFCWGQDGSANLKIISIQYDDSGTTINALYEKEKITIRIPFTDKASIENAITCWCLLLYIQIPQPIIAERMLQLQAVGMRLEMKDGTNNTSLINDSYNSDINSLRIALDFLQQQKQHKKKTLILSDILQSGKTEGDLYAEVAQLVKEKKLDRIIGVRPIISSMRSLFEGHKNFFENTDALLRVLDSLNFQDETILVKGARTFEFERIVRALEQKVHETRLEINLNHLVHNLNVYRSMLKPETKIMVMVKAFSYGSGTFEIANLLQHHRVHYMAVAYADEGVELRKKGISLPIMVMNPEEHSFELLIKNKLEPVIYSFRSLQILKHALNATRATECNIHLEFDTGMRRLGFDADDLLNLLSELEQLPEVKIKSAFTHLSASEDRLHDTFTLNQISCFNQIFETLSKKFDYSILRHCLNSGGIARFLETGEGDMVRLGIGLYGIDPSENIQQKLLPVSSLKTVISQIHNLKPGDSVSYNRRFITEKSMQVATIAVGYADGLKRNLSNGIGKVFIGGKHCPIIGSICMDMCMVDISGMQCKEGDEIEIFGNSISVNELARWANTIPYEILTGISQRVKRVYLQE